MRVNLSPCITCVPPIRHPECLCDAKRQLDQERREHAKYQCGQAIADAYSFDRYLAAVKRANT